MSQCPAAGCALVPLGVHLGDPVPVEALDELTADEAAAFRAMGYANARVSQHSKVAMARRALPDDSPYVKGADVVSLAVGSFEDRDEVRGFFRSARLAPKRIIDLARNTCTTFLTQIDIAAGSIRDGTADAVLCVMAGGVDVEAARIRPDEHVQSDGACAFALDGRSPEEPHFRVLGISASYMHPADVAYPDSEPTKPERDALKVASMRTHAQAVLRGAGIGGAEVGHFVVQNLGEARMINVAKLHGVRPETVWLDSLAPNGHVLFADSGVNLFDLFTSGRAADGDYVMVVGSSKVDLGAMLLQKVG